MKRFLYPVLVSAVSVMVAASCVQQNDCCAPPPDAAAMEGTWLLYEHGYSPGAGYITEAVPAEPAQTITFGPGNSVETNIGNMTEFRFFEVTYDTLSESHVMIFHKTNPPDENERLVSYTIATEGNTLRLNYRWCIEGCHMAFRKIAPGSDN